MSISKCLPALIVFLAVSASSVLAAEDAGSYETFLLVRRPGAVPELLPVTQDMLQAAKKTAKPESAKPSESSAAVLDSRALLETHAAAEQVPAPASETPKPLPIASTVRVQRVTTAAEQGWPSPMNPNAERLVSANSPMVYSTEEPNYERVTISRPAPAATTARVVQIERPVQPPQPYPQYTEAGYTDYHTGGRTDGGEGAARQIIPEPIAPGGQVHLSDGYPPCPQCQDCGRDNKSCFNPCGCCGCFGGVDYLYLRPSFSENTAFLCRTTAIDGSGNVTVTDTTVHQDWDYESSPRVFLGYRFGECGGEIRFTYWNYHNDASITSGPATTDTLYAGQLEINTSLPGQQIHVDTDLNLNIYDIDYSKCLCYGGRKGCNSCDCCPIWTLKYSAGVRVADISRHDNNVLFPIDTASVAGRITGDFIGAGPRVGLEGRRFCHEGCASLFARGNFGLLLGEFSVRETRLTPSVSPVLTENFVDSHNRIVPVAEIELGGSWQVSEHINVSGGYLCQAWWDLGAFEQIPGNVFINPIDDSNIMAFDGLVARVEVCF